jgi:two-component system, OmpR family, phosphate regulon response regulator PhoB
LGAKDEAFKVMAIEQSDRTFPPSTLIGAADQSFGSFLEYILRHMGLAAATESDLTALTEHLQDQRPDLLLLESRLPGIDIRALCTRLRLDKRTRGTAILVIAAEGDDMGQEDTPYSEADDYLRRPFTVDMLIATIRGLLGERAQCPEPGAPNLLTFVDLELDLVSYRVRRNGHIIHLAPTEFRLLCHFMKNPRKVHSRDELRHAAWPPSVHLGPRIVDVHIGRLRAALNEPGGQDLIRTVRSVGYSLSE